MNFQSVLKKMATELESPIQYYLDMGDDFLNVNQLIEKEIQISFVKFQCLNCGNDKKIFRQGYCYDCFYKMPQVGDWVMKPELSKAHLNIEDRDLEFEKKAQLQSHIVYLALSSNVKVGVTRKTQVPTRWIDQGASQAVPIVEVPNRYLAGIAEVALKAYVADKTSWQKMLKNEMQQVNLLQEKENLKKYLPSEVQEYYIADSQVQELNFPVQAYPKTVKSLNLEKTPTYKSVLKGIKGQYLIFEGGIVFNVRNNEGLVCEIQV